MKRFLMIAALATITAPAHAIKLMPPTVAACIKAFDGMPEQARLERVVHLTDRPLSPHGDVKVSLDDCREMLIASEQLLETTLKKMKISYRKIVLDLCQQYIDIPMMAEVASATYKELMKECEQ